MDGWCYSLYFISFKFKIMPFKLEKDFTSHFLKQFESEWWWSFKIPDIIRTIKPFDWFWVNKDWTFFCEVKIIDNDIFDIFQLRNNQFTALKRISKIIEKYNLKNIHSVVLIYSTWLDKYKMIDFSEILQSHENGINKIKIDFI